MKPLSAQIFMWLGAAIWIVVTAAAILLVLQSPGEHDGPAVGVFLIWVVLVIFAAASRVTEYIGRRPH